MGDDERGDEQPQLAGGQQAQPAPATYNGRLDAHAGERPVGHDEINAELERQAREMLDALRGTAGDLGTRVRQALGHASTLWDQTHPGLPAVVGVPPEVDRRGRQLAARWVVRDFLVDPDLPTAMTVTSVTPGRIWHVALHERGETREIAEANEAYTGQQQAAPGPVLPVWDYVFPATPEIASGVRRERLAGTGTVAACQRCNGSGHLPCAGCDGKGLVQCPDCHGRARIACRRCRGRGHIADPDAERRARAPRPYLQIQAERVAQDARDRLAGFAERLRQDYAVPLPPTHEWLPAAAASGVTIPCPDCTDGSVPCTCNGGKVVCGTCHGSAYAQCPACTGTGRVVRHSQVVRHFDTRIHQRTLPHERDVVAGWVTHEMLRKARGEDVWEGPLDGLVAGRPDDIPPDVWTAVVTFARTPGEPQASSPAAPHQRRVIARRLHLSRVPVTRVEYTFAGKPFAFVAVGREGHETFWAHEFPPRWSRVGRFLKALTRDVARDVAHQNAAEHATGLLSSLDDFRQRRLAPGDAAPRDNGPRASDEPLHEHD
ncbi:MAG: hypothetical protein ACHQ4H_07425 [Ktedonobacterales bacterium]